ncbi:MAG: thioredoxin family protein, partial [Bacteroidota bacterium]
MRFSAFVLVLLLVGCQSDTADVTVPDTPAAAVADSDAATPGNIQPGTMAPDFRLTDTGGTEHALEDFRGQTVILEWLNYDCPYVGKYYNAGNMQALQQQ